ncbi:MAG TPA: dihydroorotate dehydrogenase electron transfer subunit [Bacteroidales bacterium]|nr:dihydroorotate dehydrogenase electron transfer subunit [Bacteroidales bacterium]HPS18341.1 dihydroorotate dehydrogenase electron transfer subunit [Bacteroidales bacterium]
MKKFVQDLEVIENRELNAFHFLLTLKAPVKLPEILPGQFAEVLVENSPTTFLRRPLSTHDVDFEKNTISFYIKCVGPATMKLREYKKGDFLNVMYPLGNTFSLQPESPVLLVGGGCGVAPLLYLAKYLNKKNIEVSTLIGARTHSDLSEIKEYEKCGKIFLITEDGSKGEKGLVTGHSVFKNVNQFKKIYCCGPEPMMKAVAALAKKNKIDCEVSLENTMACGIGACLCCVTETVEGNKCVCTEGPVFNINQLKW